MTVLTWILLASAAGGLLSVLFAAVALKLRAEWIPAMVSYAVGALLGASFLEILPHALRQAEDYDGLFITVLAGMLVFFLLEKLVLWRHCHVETCEAHGAHAHAHDHGRSGLMITVGDTIHNFVDGVTIAVAFLVDVKLGVITAIAIIAHEIPQEMGDFLILLHSGYSRRRALGLNLVSSFATVLGALLGYYALAPMQEAMPYILAIAAAGMIYVAVADLIPGLHKRAELRHTAMQLGLILIGVLTVYFAGELAHGLMASGGVDWAHDHAGHAH